MLPPPKEPSAPGYCFCLSSAQATRAAVGGSRAEGGAVMRDLPGRRGEWDLGMRGWVSWGLVDVMGWDLESKDMVWVCRFGNVV